MKTIEITEPQISTLIEVLERDCQSSCCDELDYTDTDHMEFLYTRATILQRLQQLPRT